MGYRRVFDCFCMALIIPVTPFDAKTVTCQIDKMIQTFTKVPEERKKCSLQVQRIWPKTTNFL